MTYDALQKTSFDLQTSSEEVVSQLVNSEETEELKRLTQLFNVNQMKKDAIRVVRLNDLLDRLDAEVSNRIENCSDEISNRDLIEYANMIQQSINKASQNVNGIDQTPLIQFNQQNNITLDGSGLTRESRSKIVDAVQQLLSLSNDENIIDMPEEDRVYYNGEETK